MDPNQNIIIKYVFPNNNNIRNIVWPELLTHLIFNELFDQEINDVIWPELLTILEFGDAFDQDVNDVTFMNLCSLKFGNLFSQEISNAQMPCLLKLLFGKGYNRRITNDANNWSKLSNLDFGEYFNQDIMHDKFILPHNIVKLYLGKIYCRNLLGIDAKFPMLNTLILSRDYNQDITHVKFPDTLTTLEFGFAFNQCNGLNITFNSLRILYIGYNFNQYIVAYWPELRDLRFGSQFNHKLTDINCPKLECLMLGRYFTGQNRKISFPNLLTIWDNSRTITIESCTFPKSINEIIHAEDNITTTIYKRYIGQHTKAANTFF
jgi:hypothetical protein